MCVCEASRPLHGNNRNLLGGGANRGIKRATKGGSEASLRHISSTVSLTLPPSFTWDCGWTFVALHN
ncbi:hypothetical protein XELAEV_18002208mg [Xenopus laevis]|nr:hypothetical protein XELAEV_18002203mg [Xenopus laevis]OCT58269.1 hypothetical protein XELAEV_18002208mg [Xenopus laevis]